MKRRGFLSTGGTLAAGGVLARISSAQEEVVDEIRLALVGCGKQGRVLLNACSGIPSITFTAVCDIQPTARRAASVYLEDADQEVRTYADLSEMIASEGDRVDAVLIATPDFVHADQAVAAFRVGWHVYCEAPMATTSGSARRMLAAAKESGRILQIGYERRSDPRYRHASQMFASSQDIFIGRLTHFRTQSYRRVHPEPVWSEREELSPQILEKHGFASMKEYRGWKHYRAYGCGQCFLNIAQQLDGMEWFFRASPERILANGGQDYHTYGDCVDNISSLMTYSLPQGIVRGDSVVWTTTSGGGLPPSEHFYGENGSVTLSLNAGEVKIYAEPGLADWSELVRRGWLRKADESAPDEDPNLIRVRETGNVVTYLFPMERTESVTRLHLNNFVRACAGLESLNCTGEDAFQSHETAWKILDVIENDR